MVNKIALLLMLCACTAYSNEVVKQSGVKGGLVVHLGTINSDKTAALAVNESYTIHGLTRDVKLLQQENRGKVTFQQLHGTALPYIDNLVNLIVVEDACGVSEKEMLRVLSPNGIAMLKSDGAWKKLEKARPKNISEWTHYLYDASNNAVAPDDVVAAPRRLQWIAGPAYLRSHHTLASVSAVVSSGNRLFYIADDGAQADIRSAPHWSLVACDAFNGLVLWKKTINKWAYHLRKFRSGPVQLKRILVAQNDKLYVTMSISAPVSCIDAATGKVLHVYKESTGTEELLLKDDMLYILRSTTVSSQSTSIPGMKPKGNTTKEVLAFNTTRNELIWKHEISDLAKAPLPQSLTIGGDKLFFASKKTAFAFDSKNGKPLWECTIENIPKAAPVKTNKIVKKKKKRKPRPAAGMLNLDSRCTMVYSDGVLLFANGNMIKAMDVANGAVLWSHSSKEGFRAAHDVLVIDGIVWGGVKFSEGRELKTGKIIRESDVISKLQTPGHHHRCYREKATSRFIMTGHRGIEMFDLKGEEHTRNNWVRGLCQYGIMPCNGLIYAPPHSCSCYMETMLPGFLALAPQETEKVDGSFGERLVKGPAYGSTQSMPHDPQSWPIHRCDGARSGGNNTAIPTKLKQSWSLPIKGKLTAPVISGGLAVVANQTINEVIAADAETGMLKWKYVAGGRVDSPPTFFNNSVYFGATDGWIYCLTQAEGKLVWKYRAAPDTRQMIVYEAVESLWPVHGSVLITEGKLYASAGRSSYLDGGIQLVCLDPATGNKHVDSEVVSTHATLKNGGTPDSDRPKILAQNKISWQTTDAPDKTDGFSMEGGKTDIMVADGDSIFMRQMRFDKELNRQTKNAFHLFSTSALIDDSENHRGHWVYGSGDFSHTVVAYSWIAYRPKGSYKQFLGVPYGFMMTFNETTVWGIQRSNNHVFTLYCRDKKQALEGGADQRDFRRGEPGLTTKNKWAITFEYNPKAMVRAGKYLVIAGVNPDPAYDYQTGVALPKVEDGFIKIYSAETGEEISSTPISGTVLWDSLAVANGKLYATTTAGTLICLSK